MSDGTYRGYAFSQLTLVEGAPGVLEIVATRRVAFGPSRLTGWWVHQGLEALGPDGDWRFVVDAKDFHDTCWPTLDVAIDAYEARVARQGQEGTDGE